jgi:hypothetical protein
MTTNKFENGFAEHQSARSAPSAPYVDVWEYEVILLRTGPEPIELCLVLIGQSTYRCSYSSAPSHTLRSKVEAYVSIEETENEN